MSALSTYLSFNYTQDTPLVHAQEGMCLFKLPCALLVVLGRSLSCSFKLPKQYESDRVHDYKLADKYCVCGNITGPSTV